jgi:hypothetical protein
MSQVNWPKNQKHKYPRKACYLFVSMAFLSVFTLTGCAEQICKQAYDKGYKEGENKGSQQGFVDGKNAGFNEGSQQGFTKGYAEGKTAGYNEGIDQGAQQNFAKGYALAGGTQAGIFAGIGFTTGLLLFLYLTRHHLAKVIDRNKRSFSSKKLIGRSPVTLDHDLYNKLFALLAEIEDIKKEIQSDKTLKVHSQDFMNSFKQIQAKAIDTAITIQKNNNSLIARQNNTKNAFHSNNDNNLNTLVKSNNQSLQSHLHKLSETLGDVRAKISTMTTNRQLNQLDDNNENDVKILLDALNAAFSDMNNS